MKIPLDDVMAAFTASEDEFLEFGRIPVADKLHPNRTLCGLLYVGTLMESPEKFHIDAEHEVFWFSKYSELKRLTTEDVIYLERCGVFWDSDVERFTMYA